MLARHRLADWLVRRNLRERDARIRRGGGLDRPTHLRFGCEPHRSPPRLLNLNCPGLYLTNNYL